MLLEMQFMIAPQLFHHDNKSTYWLRLIKHKNVLMAYIFNDAHILQTVTDCLVRALIYYGIHNSYDWGICPEFP